MSNYDPDRMNAALAEIDQLTANYEAAKQALEEERENLRQGIVKHLTERNAPPGKLADRSPYDRNHVGRIARDADVPPLRGAKQKE